jgi:hypothetical protein
MIPVISSNVKSIGYNPKNKITYVKFNNDSMYVYFGVPRETFENFKKAESKGKFLHLHIKNSYSYLKFK